MVVFDLNLFPSSITCSQHCRNMIHAGYDPQTPIKFVRGQTPIFNETFPLSHWAELECIESRDGSWMRYQSVSARDLQGGPQESRKPLFASQPTETHERTTL